METLNRLVQEAKRIKKKFGYESNLPISDEEAIKFKETFFTVFGVDAPEGYIHFLKMMDGMDFNGYQIYGATNNLDSSVPEGILENNQLWQEYTDEDNLERTSYIVFAESGQELFVLNKHTMAICSVDKVSDDIIEIFPTFEDMLARVISYILET